MTDTAPPTPSVAPVGRDDIHRAIDRAVARPLTTVTAARGYGKTTMLASWARTRGAAWLSLDGQDRDPHVFGRRLVEVLRGDGQPSSIDPDAQLDEVAAAVAAAASQPPSKLVLDEADQLAGSAALDLLRRILAVPGSRVRAVVAGRLDLGLVDDRVRARGGALEIDAGDLAFTSHQVAQLLRDDGVPDADGLAPRITDMTGGWPAVVHRVGEVVRATTAARPDRDAIEVLGVDEHLTAVFDELLLGEEDPDTLEVLAELALLADTSAEELARIRGTATRLAARTLEDLVRRGLARPTGHTASYARSARVELAPAVRRAVLDDLVAREEDRDGVVAEVVEGLTTSGELARAIRALADIGATDAVLGLLESHGDALVASGEASTIAAAASMIGDRATPGVRMLHGDALEAMGDLAGAVARFRSASAMLDASGDAALIDALTLRTGRIQYLQGEFDAALTTFRGDGARLDPEIGLDGRGGLDRRVGLELRAWWSATHLLRGEDPDARDLATASLEHAQRLGDPREIARAHAVLALVAAAGADHRTYERHDRQAFSGADRAGDQQQLAWIRVHRASHHLAEGRTTEALFEADRALGLTSAPAMAPVRALALCGRAEVLLRTGRMDAAADEAASALALLERLGSRRARHPWHLLGDVHRERGELDAAREAYERALALAEPDRDRNAILAATIGLARTVAATDVDRARDHASRALSVAGPGRCAPAHLAAAWVALAGDDRDRAQVEAGEADDVGRQRRDERAIAEAATLSAIVADDPVPGLRYAARLWHRLHDPLWATRTELAVARRTGALDERSRAGDLEQRLARLGSVVRGGELANQILTGAGSGGPVEVRVLGGFALYVRGEPVDAAGWPNEDARSVLMALAVGGGRSVAREELARRVWPDRSGREVEPLLTDAIADLRRVLGHDGHTGTPLGGDGTALRLRVESIDVDLHTFERTADRGLRALHDGRVREAEALLRTAAAAYRGELLAGEAAARWAESPRAILARRADEVHHALQALDG